MTMAQEDDHQTSVSGNDQVGGGVAHHPQAELQSRVKRVKHSSSVPDHPSGEKSLLNQVNQSQSNGASSAGDKGHGIMGKKAKSLSKKSAFEEHLEKIHQQSAVLVEDYEATWPRPAFNLAQDQNCVVFQQIDIDEYACAHPGPHFPNPYLVREASALRLYGVTMEGHSVVCHVHGFYPYFYVPAPMGFQSLHLNDYIRSLDAVVRSNFSRGANQRAASEAPVVLDVQMVQKSSIYGYHGQSKALFLKVIVRLSSAIATCKRMFKEGFNVPNLGVVTCSQTFESNIPFTLRFMIDCRIPGVNWVQVPLTSIRAPENRISTAQLELDVAFQSIISHQPEGEWSKIAPLRILSFDIECAGRPGVFPEAKVDPVIQIANIVTAQGESRPFIKNVFTLNTCGNIVGTQILSFQEERELLQKWRDFIVEVDPDIIIGYNINGFDFPYLLDRAEALGVSEFPFLGRISGQKTNAKDTRFSSKAQGTRDSKNINLEGRLQMDVLQIMQRDHKLRSYTLNSVCAHFLGEQKEDVHHSIISELQNGNEETRRRLAVYCLKDAYLPQRLVDKLMCIINYMEMARVTGVPFNYLLTRGQQIKVVSQLYRAAMPEDLIVPALEIEGTDEQYEGATVIEPMKGFYSVPISTLDFSSLYPSIMMAHNLCYSTYLQSKDHAALHNLVEGTDYKRTPNGDLFLIKDVRKGLLPTILENLLSARKRAKSDLKKETDPFKRAVLDGRQLALKISANSVYGFTGATIGKLPLLAISSSVTAYGREMIELTKKLVEEKYQIANGYKHDAIVVYGDTDSVMVKFGVSEVGEAMELGREAAAYVTTHFMKPINLEFEKVYFPYLLINKKRYAGLYWTRPDVHDKMDAKGIETVRRDSCRLVSNVIDTVLHMLLERRDTKGAEEYAKKVISELLQNKIDLSMLVISKALGKAEYAAKQAHNELAERMRKRDANGAPQIGDRVSYVIVRGAKGAAAYEKAEDPLYVLEHNLPIDTKYYLENQLSKPLLRIFEPILGAKAQSLLSGDHTRTITVAAPSMGGLMKFVKKMETCLGCKAPLKNGDKVICMHCKPMLPDLYQRSVDSLSTSEIRFAKLWTNCQRCQGSLLQDVICTSSDCPIFYSRKKVQKETKDAFQLVQKFQFAW